MMLILPTASSAQNKRFMLVGLGDAILLETTGSSTNQAFFSVVELECTPNPADNNCWILVETNTPGWTGHP
jgi:hypothetical protein